MTALGGAVGTYTCNGSNENTKIATSLGSSTYMTYDKYENLLTTATYDPDAGTKYQNWYTDDGNFQSASVDNKGYCS